MYKLKTLGALIIFNTTISSLECSYLRQELYPNIEDVISFTNADTVDKEPMIPENVIARNFSIDIEKLDIQKFRRNQALFQKQILGDDLLDDDLSIELNDTRRKKNNNKNIKIPPYKFEGIPFLNSNNATLHKAHEVQIVTKLADIMLQTIFMARQKIKTLEREEVVEINKETKSYRISFLYNNLRNYWKKMSNIYVTMKDNHWQMSQVMHDTAKNRKFSPWLSLNPFIILHHKGARVHVDFLKTWWMFVKIYERGGGRNTTPRE